MMAIKKAFRESAAGHCSVDSSSNPFVSFLHSLTPTRTSTRITANRMKLVLNLVFCAIAHSWIPSAVTRRRQTCLDASVGIYYGTSTGNTMTCAQMIYEALGPEVADEPVDVDEIKDVQTAFRGYDALIVGTPTWNTGADTERSGTGWDDLYYTQLPKLKEALEGKKIAVFGLGDQESYDENFADATGELFDAFEGLGCKMYGSWSQEGYEHKASKSVRGDVFCGLILDMINQEELTEDRIEQWVDQLGDEGFLEASQSAKKPVEMDTHPKVEVEKTVDRVEPVVAVNGSNGETAVPPPLDLNGIEERLVALEEDRLDMLEENSRLLESEIDQHSSGGFIPHHNPTTGKTMWTSPDGTKCYVTVDTVKQTKLSP